MKNPKILYILIGVCCFVALALGIYAQFFVDEENKSNIIIPTPDYSARDDKTEKTAEELREQLKNLFTNVLNKGEYDTSSIAKINPEQDIVYATTNMKKQENNYEININLPAMNIQGEVPASFNNITQTIFANKAIEILNSTSETKKIYQINYTAYINGDILSLVIRGNLKEGDNPQRIMIQTYNYNLKTGEKVEIADLISQKGLVQSEVQSKIKTTISKAKEEAEIISQSGYPAYNRDLESDMYKIDNLSTYFLGPNGELYIIFAYGNQNYTVEMDIVLYE